jgi:hypothetical protein
MTNAGIVNITMKESEDEKSVDIDEEGNGESVSHSFLTLCYSTGVTGVNGTSNIITQPQD